MYGVLFVCLGNICRSPLAEGIFRKLAQERGLLKEFDIDSCGVMSWNTGNPPHPESCAIAKENGISISKQRARAISAEDFRRFDLILAADEEVYAELISYNPKQQAKIRYLRSYDPRSKSVDIEDPYHTGNFEDVYRIILRSCEHLLEELEGRSL